MDIFGSVSVLVVSRAAATPGARIRAFVKSKAMQRLSVKNLVDFFITLLKILPP
jgi:hypothetical protein